jgi:transposase
MADDWITLQHLPLMGAKVFLRLRPKRFRCPSCADGPTTTQELTWYRSRSPFTTAFEEHLLFQCVNSTIEDVSLKWQVGYDAIAGVLDQYRATRVNWQTFATLGVLRSDEIALRKGHRQYVVRIRARLPGGQTRLLAVLPDRTQATVEAFLRTIPDRLRQTVTAVCTDMHDRFLAAIRTVVGADAMVIDRFHVAKHDRAAADDLRKTEMARLKRERTENE